MIKREFLINSKAEPQCIINEVARILSDLCSSGFLFHNFYFSMNREGSSVSVLVVKGWERVRLAEVEKECLDNEGGKIL